MATTYVLLGSVTVGAGGAASIDFTSIPGTYTDLIIDLSARCTIGGAWNASYIKFNGVTTGYSSRNVYSQGATVASNASTDGYIGDTTASTATASTFSNNSIYIPNYAGSTNKSVSVDWSAETNATAASLGLTAQVWSNTAAITSISLSSSSGNLAQYSTAYLYGVKNA